MCDRQFAHTAYLHLGQDFQSHFKWASVVDNPLTLTSSNSAYLFNVQRQPSHSSTPPLPIQFRFVQPSGNVRSTGTTNVLQWNWSMSDCSFLDNAVNAAAFDELHSCLSPDGVICPARKSRYLWIGTCSPSNVIVPGCPLFEALTRFIWASNMSMFNYSIQWLEPSLYIIYILYMAT